ncbi:MAG: hypothetical protein EKK53_24985 [Burkholderiales bacterium]|nr:MAG: hypothetical protein EKK53_24985 [Burkholderiales bacterium]
MKTLRQQLLVLGLTAVAAFQAHAGTVSVGATADDWFIPVVPGVYTAFNTSGNPTDPYLRTFGNAAGVNRSALEFSLAGISAGSVIDSAKFTIQSRGTSVAGGTFKFWGYSGDGAITAADALQTTTLVGTAATQNGQPQYIIDVTSLIQTLIDTNANYAGILITVSPEGNFFGSDFVSKDGVAAGFFAAADAPNLLVDFHAGNQLPTPGTLPLALLAGVTALGFARRKA